MFDILLNMHIRTSLQDRKNDPGQIRPIQFDSPSRSYLSLKKKGNHVMLLFGCGLSAGATNEQEYKSSYFCVQCYRLSFVVAIFSDIAQP